MFFSLELGAVVTVSLLGGAPLFVFSCFQEAPMRLFRSSSLTLSTSLLVASLSVGALLATACGSSDDENEDDDASGETAGDGDSSGGDGDATSGGDGDAGAGDGGASAGDGDAGGDGDGEPGVDTTPDCGGVDQECCEQAQCDDGFACQIEGMRGEITQMCVACGGADEACCAGNECSEGVCVGFVGGSCETECGGEGQNCCGGGGGGRPGESCEIGLSCEQDTCEVSDDFLDCGTTGLACCEIGRNQICIDGSDCMDGTCAVQ